MTEEKCRSRYTVDPNQVLECDIPIDRHLTYLRGELGHMATAYGIRWTWKDGEANK